VERELHDALAGLEEVLAEGDGPVRLDGAGDLVISPLIAQEAPAQAGALKAELTEMLSIVSLPEEAVDWLKTTFLKTELELGHCLGLPQ
jgi:hypothetical protein